MKKAVIAVDAGGTKTRVALIDEKKRIVSEIYGPAGSPAATSPDASFSVVSGLVEEMSGRFSGDYDIVCVQMGVSGFGIIPDPAAFERRLCERLGLEVAVYNDGYVTLHSLMKGKRGEWIAVISGTGSSCYATNGRETLLLGGYGHLLTEAGSAHAAVKTAAAEAIRQFEEGEPLSPLSRALMEEVGIDNVYRFKVFFFNNPKSKIAERARFISARALAGDEEATAILKQCGRDLARWVKLQYKHLSLSPAARIGLFGSFVTKAAFVREALLKDLRDSGYNPEIAEDSEDPIYGAYYLALERGKL